MSEQLPEGTENRGPDCYGGHDRETYFKMVERRNAMLDSQRVETMGYIHKLSAWMIAQLFVANSGALALTSDQGESDGQIAFVIGLVAAMACSLSAWWQSHSVYHHIFEVSGPEAYADIKHWKGNNPDRSKVENRLLTAAIGSGAVSLIAFAIGAAITIL